MSKIDKEKIVIDVDDYFRENLDFQIVSSEKYFIITCGNDLGRDIIYEDVTDFSLINTKILDTRRWVSENRAIFKHIPTGAFFSVSYELGLTESQDVKPFDYNKPEFYLVFPEEVTIINYVTYKK